MPSRPYRLLLAQTLVVASVSAGCKQYECTHTHVEDHPAVPDEYVYWPSDSGGFGLTPYGAGIHIGGGMHLIPGHDAWSANVCDQWQEVK